MWSTDKIIHILTYRNRPKLAQALRGTTYDLNESSTYGSRLYSRLTTVEVYAPIYQHDQLQKLADEMIGTKGVLHGQLSATTFGRFDGEINPRHHGDHHQHS